MAASISECDMDIMPGNKALRSEQRESVISSASSNTTSGIVSDRVLSFDESEGQYHTAIITFQYTSIPFNTLLLNIIIIYDYVNEIIYVFSILYFQMTWRLR